MRNLILIFFILVQQTNSFIFPNFLRNINLPKVDVSKIENLPKIDFHNNDICNHIHNINDNMIHHFKTVYSPEIVKFSSGLLPAMDSVAHHVLKANENFISFVLSADKIPDHIKKDLVLFSISSAQHGDQMGSHILDLYYHLVEKLL